MKLDLGERRRDPSPGWGYKPAPGLPGSIGGRGSPGRSLLAARPRPPDAGGPEARLPPARLRPREGSALFGPCPEEAPCRARRKRLTRPGAGAGSPPGPGALPPPPRGLLPACPSSPPAPCAPTPSPRSLPGTPFSEPAGLDCRDATRACFSPLQPVVGAKVITMGPSGSRAFAWHNTPQPYLVLSPASK